NDIFLGEVIEQTAALTDELQQSATRRKVVFVLCHVLGQVLDTLGDQCDLHFGCTGVAFREFESLLNAFYDIRFVVTCKCHGMVSVRKRFTATHPWSVAA